MTLDEAIIHCEEVANDMAKCCDECAEEHRQLAEWLKELKQYKEQTDGDLINRTDLLKELEKWDWQDTYLPIHFAELVADLPSAEKTAEWVNNKCSICDKGIEDLIDSREWYENEKPNYCPYCGARMKGVE